MLQIDRFGRIAIATVTEAPRLDATNAEPLGSQLSEYCLKYPGSHLLLDLHQIEYLSSAAITQIIKAYRELEKQGGGLRVCGVNPYVADVFHVTNLDTIFHSMEDVTEAACQYNEDLQTAG
ncbi:MAG TPA: STAS domain-containing protein [Candidatus Hydrogenedentes bacterium]|jgi:anti-sigma B factor antagonist|nr:STAS domain-containing protein [Candidatus Hydrogenedentota bacterium]MDY0030523.1 STAS domain-containing protein [FCB group bacterium]NLT60018.1 STAS domain-containing protein [Candidatus Hydrogenedentota bacterium]HNZ18220.1 STAS domain-containing protein [Candidatus Hydrogenedentota bacterium]HOH33443.1 STAS domain-containing protein [Candidatus Hydrogenedentota bacterium]